MGTGFPKVFYLKYHLYRLYFPITALARYRRLMERGSVVGPPNETKLDRMRHFFGVYRRRRPVRKKTYFSSRYEKAAHFVRQCATGFRMSRTPKTAFPRGQ